MTGEQPPPDTEPRHTHEESLYEPVEYLGAPLDEPIPEREVSLARRVLNWKTIASVAVAIIILALAFRTLGVNFAGTVEVIGGADLGFLALAFGAYYLTFPLRGFRWRYVLGKVGTRIGFKDATEILFLSWFVNCVVPAKLGDLYRAYLLKGNQGASASRTVGTIFIERIADIIVIFALALAAGFWSFRGRSSAEVDLVFLLGFIMAVVLVAFVAALRIWGDRLTRFLPARFRELYERFHEGSTGALTVRALPVIGALTVSIWMLEGARLYFVIRALDLPDAGIGISAAVFVSLVAALLTAMPLTPAGIGFVEAGIAGALVAFYSVGQDSAAAVALTDRGISILTVIILGGILYLVSDKVRRAHRSRAVESPG
jgi:hypothetical protein